MPDTDKWSPACNCCGGTVVCNNCEDDVAPAEILVAFSGVADYLASCVDCASFNATHTLSAAASGQCLTTGPGGCPGWGVLLDDLDNYVDPGTPPFVPASCQTSSGYWTCVGIVASVEKSGSDYILTVTVQLCKSGTEPCTLTATDYGHEVVFSKNFGTTKPDCDSWSSLSIPYSSELTENPAGGDQSCDWSSATCTVTAN